MNCWSMMIILGAASMAQAGGGSTTERPNSIIADQRQVNFHISSKTPVSGFTRVVGDDGSTRYVGPRMFDERSVKRFETTDGELTLTVDAKTAVALEEAVAKYRTQELGIIAQGALIATAPFVQSMSLGSRPEHLIILEGLTERALDRILSLLAARVSPESNATLSVGVRRTGDVIIADVFVEHVAQLGGYEITVEAVGGDAGALLPLDMWIDTDRADYVFGDRQAYDEGDWETMSMTNYATDAPAVASSERYVGTFIFEATPDASGTFFLQPGSDGRLSGADGESVTFVWRRGSLSLNRGELLEPTQRTANLRKAGRTK